MTSTTAASRSRRALDPDRLAELEEERRFLLRSIADLDAEHAAGDVDDEDWASLRDGYTARAAAVLRAIDAGRSALPPRRRGRPLVVAAWVVGVLAVGVLAGWLVARSSGQRLAGQGMTGGQPVDAVTQKLSEARAALGTDPATAISKYREVLDIDKNNAEALTYTAWLLAQSVFGVSSDAGNVAMQQALKLFDQVTSAHPEYADAHCFYAITEARFVATPDLALAKAQAEQCLADNPPAEMVPMIQQFVTSLDSVPAGGASTVPAGAATTAPAAAASVSSLASASTLGGAVTPAP